MKPLCIDLFCGLGGWSEGFLAEGYECIGFDIERHDYGTGGYPGQLVLQDVTTLHGSQFRNATVIVASPPCQEFSYMAMPWSRAKKIAAEYRDGTRDVADLTRLFDACFRIQREACEAAGHRIPLVVENVRGAQPWVGPAKWHYGSFYLWGDVPTLMPSARSHAKIPGQDWNRFKKTGEVSPHWRMEGLKVQTVGKGRRTDVGKGARFTSRDCGVERWSFQGAAVAGVKQGGEWWHDPESMTRRFSSKSPARKAASAMIAKIPFELARHIARTYKPKDKET